jgi:hypothetical protein
MAETREDDMQRERYPHKVAALYPDAAAAKAAITALAAADLGDREVMQLEPGATDIDRVIEPETEATGETVTRDMVSGGAAGTVAGAAVAGASTLVAPTLFVSAPVVGPLIVLGYGAVIGGVPGAIRGLRLREGVLAGLVKDALESGCYVVLVHVANDELKRRAQDVLDQTMAEDTSHT